MLLERSECSQAAGKTDIVINIENLRHMYVIKTVQKRKISIIITRLLNTWGGYAELAISITCAYNLYPDI